MCYLELIMLLNCGHRKKSYICALEKIHRSFTKYIARYQNLPYSERLKSLWLYSLQRRRDCYLVIYMWKIAEGLAPNLSPAIRFYNTERRGWLCYQEQVPNNHLGTLCHNSFRHHGCLTLYQPTLEILQSVNLRH